MIHDKKNEDFFFIMIDEVNSISGEGVIFCDKTIDIENERSFNVPRGGMIGNYYLHPFTLCDISHEKGNKKIKSIQMILHLIIVNLKFANLLKISYLKMYCS